MTNTYDKQSFGMGGNITLTSAQGLTTFDACVLHCIEDTSFTTLTDSLQSPGGAAVTGRTYTQGTVLYGKFSQVQVTSGAVRCYLSLPLS